MIQDRRRTLRLAIGWLLLLAGLLIFLQQTAGWPRTGRLSLDPASIDSAKGLAYTVSGARIRSHLDHVHPHAGITENGVPLPHRVSVSREVEQAGGGSFTFGAKTVWFSASDNSDPRTNGCAYVIVFPDTPSKAWTGVAWLACLGGISLTLRFRPWLIWHSIEKSAAAFRPSTRREWGLDLIRALAVFLVLGRHGRPCGEDASSMLHHFTTLWQRGGWIGVDLFFVLSGYLVSGLLWDEWQRTQKLDIGRFLFRRACKIYPAFWVMILATLIISSFADVPDFTVNGVIGELTFLQNYVGGMWNHTWSLAVEEHFYLLLALAFAMSAGGRYGHGPANRFLPKLALFIAGACLAIRCLRQLYMGDLSASHYFLTHARLDALMFGVLIRWMRVTKPDAFARMTSHGGWLTPVALLLLAPAFMLNFGEGWWNNVIGLTFNYVAGGCLLLSAGLWEKGKRFQRLAAPLVFVGRHSYSVYLWHLPVAVWLAEPLWEFVSTKQDALTAWLIYSLCYYAGAIAVGIGMSRLIEQPVLRWRDHWFPAAAKTT